MRVLVADDDPLARHVVCTLVRSYGYTVLAAQDGLEAWDLIQSEDISLLLTDWQMPGLDGPSLIQRVRAAALPHYISCLLLTIRDGQSDRLYGLDVGADDYLVKPVHPDELRARIAVAARLLRLERELWASNARLEELAAQLHHQANHDALTGLLNRQGVMTHAALELARTQRTGQPLGAALLDLDHFKQVNDRYGHAAGDTVLAQVAAHLRAAVRPYDLVGRWGGEEFLLLLPGAPEEVVYTVAERVRAQVAAAELSIPDGGTVAIHVSIGVTSTADGAVTLEDLVAVADQALYVAKGAGRNRVSFAERGQSKLG
jgi:diguanylate cyclase (GGDEF)-like protein